MAYTLNLKDGGATLNLIDGTNYDLVEGGLSMGTPQERPAWGGAESLFRDGADLIESRFENRSIIASLKIMGTTLTVLRTNLRAIEAMLERARARTVSGFGTGITLEYGIVGSDKLTFDVLQGRLDLPRDYMSVKLDKSFLVHQARLTLTCKPFGRDTAVSPADSVIANHQGNAALKGAVADDGGAQTDETAAANNVTANDMTLLPAVGAGSPAVNDAYYFGFHMPSTKLTLNFPIGAQGTTWTITWEYWNGSAFSALSGVTDDTQGFFWAGTRDVTYTKPTDWATCAVLGITAYWIRGRLSMLDSITTSPIGTQAWYTAVNYTNYASVNGDVAATLKLKIAQTGATGNKKVWVARRSGSRQTDTLWKQGEARTSWTAVSWGTESEQVLAACSGGKFSQVYTAATGASAQIGGYHTFNLGATAPQGLFKILVRIRDRSGTAAKHRWGLGYVFGDVTAAPSAAVSGDWVNPSALNVWEVLDLGQLLIPPISTPTGETLPDYNLRIYQGHSDTIETVYFDLDFVFLLPMDEAVAIIDAVPAAQKLLLDTQSDVPSVYLTDASDVVQSRPDYLGTAPLLGQENTRIYILRDDAIAVAFTFDPNYIPRYMVV